MEDILSENHNQQQYTIMLSRIDAYERGQLGIGDLVNNLDGLFHALENVPISWRQKFISYWGSLEIALALALEQGSTKLDEKSLKIVTDVIAHLKLLILNKIVNPSDNNQRN